MDIVDVVANPRLVRQNTYKEEVLEYGGSLKRVTNFPEKALLTVLKELRIK
jgi:hypothetical protein